MSTQTNQHEQATRLRRTGTWIEHATPDANGQHKAVATLIQNPDCFAIGDTIVEAVNLHGAYQELEKAARNLSLEVSTCPHCEGCGLQHPAMRCKDACHTCGGSGKVCSTPYSGEAETLLRTLAKMKGEK